MAANLRKKSIVFLKIAISCILVYFIFTKVDVAQVFQIVKRTNPFYLVLALMFFMVSKVIAAFRLNLFFYQISVRLTQISNLKLYLLGMFYNLFLPGGIGGDAYKGYLIKKKFGIATKKVLSVLVMDRLSGLLLLFVYACFLAILVESDRMEVHASFFILGIVLSVGFYWALIKKLFPQVFPIFWKSFGYSALVQLTQLCSAWCILAALALDDGTVAYLLIFLLSSIASVLPITIGGIGSREVTFYYGSRWLDLNQDASISISMIFFFITAVVSLSGVWYHFRKPVLETDNK